jgi:hypothetical protein
MEALVPGLRLILTGKGEEPGGLWPPQAGKKQNNKEMVTTTHSDRPRRNLPMYPLVAVRVYPDERIA